MTINMPILNIINNEHWKVIHKENNYEYKISDKGRIMGKNGIMNTHIANNYERVGLYI